MDLPGTGGELLRAGLCLSGLMVEAVTATALSGAGIQPHPAESGSGNEQDCTYTSALWCAGDLRVTQLGIWGQERGESPLWRSAWGTEELLESCIMIFYMILF